MLNGKVAVVTGASRGIGRQIAISMAKEGAVVIVNYNGSAAKAEDVVKEIIEAGGQAEAVQCNVSDYSAAEVFLKDIISRYKRIDILVNNAGITRDNLLMKMSEEEFDAVIDTNLKGAFNCIKHVSRQMVVKESEAMIINVGVGRAWFNHTWTLNDALLPLVVPQSEILLNRYDAVVLEVDSREAVRANADVNKRLADKELKIALTDEAKDFIIENGYDPVYGARPLKRYLQKNVETLAAKMILADGVRAGDTIEIGLSDGKLTASAVHSA